MINGNVGPYQIIYLKDKTSVIYSKMFDKIEVALDFAHKIPGRWLLLQKIGHDGDDYAWKLLPYGASSSFHIGVKADHVRYILIGLAVLVLIYFARRIFSLKPKLPIY